MDTACNARGGQGAINDVIDFERRGNNLQSFKDFRLENNPRFWPRLSRMCRIRSAAWQNVGEEGLSYIMYSFTSFWKSTSPQTHCSLLPIETYCSPLPIGSDTRCSTEEGRFRGGLVFKAHRLVFHSTLGSKVIKQAELLERRRVDLVIDELVEARVQLVTHLRELIGTESQFATFNFSLRKSGSKVY